MQLQQLPKQRERQMTNAAQRVWDRYAVSVCQRGITRRRRRGREGGKQVTRKDGMGERNEMK